MCTARAAWGTLARGIVALGITLVLACCGGSRVDSGRDALLAVKGGEFHRGAWPDDAARRWRRSISRAPH